MSESISGGQWEQRPNTKHVPFFLLHNIKCERIFFTLLLWPTYLTSWSLTTCLCQRSNKLWLWLVVFQRKVESVFFFVCLFSNRFWMISGQKLIYWAFKPWWKDLISPFDLIRRGRDYVFQVLHGKVMGRIWKKTKNFVCKSPHFIIFKHSIPEFRLILLSSNRSISSTSAQSSRRYIEEKKNISISHTVQAPTGPFVEAVDDLYRNNGCIPFHQ